MGILDHISELCSIPRYNRGPKRNQQFQTVEMKVRIDCEGCERKVRKALKGMKGISTVNIEPKLSKVTVTGYVDSRKLIQRLRWRTGKLVELWPYVPYDVVQHPYAPGAYDKRAPPGYVRDVMDNPRLAPLARASSMEERYSNAFSDENPKSCTIM